MFARGLQVKRSLGPALVLVNTSVPCADRSTHMLLGFIGILTADEITPESLNCAIINTFGSDPCGRAEGDKPAKFPQNRLVFDMRPEYRPFGSVAA